MVVLKKIFSILLRVGISIILLILLFRQADEKSLLEIIRNVNKPLLFLAFLVFFLTYVLGLLRWVMLLKAVNIHLPIKRVITSFSGGIFFSLFLPSTIGGDFCAALIYPCILKNPRK